MSKPGSSVSVKSNVLTYAPVCMLLYPCKTLYQGLADVETGGAAVPNLALLQPAGHQDVEDMTRILAATFTAIPVASWPVTSN